MGTSTTFPYRGGCWISSARFARSAIRFRHDTTGIHFPFLGFRPAADAAPLAFRVLRGGCWISSARNARSAYRGRGVPGNRYKCLGFRPVDAAPTSRVDRGGSWIGSVAIARSAGRYARKPGGCGRDLGFRPAADGSPRWRVYRGGSWFASAGYSARHRGGSELGSRGMDLGFRPAADVRANRKIRGGCWGNSRRYARSENLDGAEPIDDQFVDLGFRPVEAT